MRVGGWVLLCTMQVLCVGIVQVCVGIVQVCVGIVQVLCRYCASMCRYCAHIQFRDTLCTAQRIPLLPELVSSDLHLTIHKMHIWAFANSHFTLHICELGHRALNCGLCLTLQMRMSKKWSG